MAKDTWGSYIGKDLGTTRFEVDVSREFHKWLNETYPPQILSPTLVGIEIECENGLQHPADFPPLLNLAYNMMWRVTEDGSLRNRGLEFVTQSGLTATQASQALEILSEIFRQQYPNIEANNRTGVHIHLNCLDKTPQQIASFIAAYCLVEKSLFTYSGGRTENHFCVPVRTSDNSVPLFLREVRKGTYIKQLYTTVRNVPKYLGLNIGALAKFGTIELRQAKGTANPHTVIPWLRTLVQLFDWAVQQPYEELLGRIRDLNTNSQYDQLMRVMLPPAFIEAVGHGSIVADMVVGSTFVKASLIEGDTTEEPHPVEAIPDFDPGVWEDNRPPDQLRDEYFDPVRGLFVNPPHDLPIFHQETYQLYIAEDTGYWTIGRRDRNMEPMYESVPNHNGEQGRWMAISEQRVRQWRERREREQLERAAERARLFARVEAAVAPVAPRNRGPLGRNRPR